jgi:anti-sigma factor RsiW
MRCAKLRKQVSSYIDDRLGRDDKEAFSSHIRNCLECRNILEEEKALHELFASAERFPAPYGFTTRVMANLTAEESSRWWALFARRPLVLRALEVSFALIVFLTGLHLGNRLTDMSPPTEEATIQASLSLDLFQATPPDSVGGVYVGLAEATHEK